MNHSLSAIKLFMSSLQNWPMQDVSLDHLRFIAAVLSTVQNVPFHYYQRYLQPTDKGMNRLSH